MKAKAFKTIVITSPEIANTQSEIMHEGEAITELLRGGIDLVHLRKPFASEKHVEVLVECIPSDLRGRLSVHGCFDKALRLGIERCHINSRNPIAPEGVNLSKSCHSLQEVEQCAISGCYNYVTLSPIFDSISKKGYGAKFDLTSVELRNTLDFAANCGLEVIALGGVSPSRFSILRDAGFSGAALLGYVWKGEKTLRDIVDEVKSKI